MHDGHKAIIEKVRQKHSKTVIVLGISPALGSRRNPLDFPTREKMIKKTYPELVVLPLSDHPLDARWSANLDRLLADTFPASQFKLYGGRDSFIKYYSGNNEVYELTESSEHNSTEIRQKNGDKVIDSEDFRNGIIYAYSNTYLKVYPTVDIAVFRNNKTEILLGKKNIDHKWRLMGGFADPTDESYEATALRELKEECGDIQTTEMRYEGSFNVNDWRYKREADKIITCLFTTEFISGEPEGSDDIAEVSWFPLEKLPEMMKDSRTAEEHFPQFQSLLNKYLTK